MLSAKADTDGMLTINDDLYHPEVNFSPGINTSFTRIRSFISLLDATYHQVAIFHEFVTDLKGEEKKANTETSINISKIFTTATTWT